jgi:hypothetical protein
MAAKNLAHLYEMICFLGGGIFRGIQKGDPTIGLNALILFDDASLPPAQRSTMCLPPHQLTAAAVQAAILKKQKAYAAFQTFAEKAATRVLGQFAEAE